MSDDTPTTDEVRDKYAEEWIEGEYFGNSDEGTRAEFDRWLAREKAEAWGEGYAEGGRDKAPYCTCWRTGITLHPIVVDPCCPLHRTVNTTLTSTIRANAEEAT